MKCGAAARNALLQKTGKPTAYYILPDVHGNSNTEFPVVTKRLCFEGKDGHRRCGRSGAPGKISPRLTDGGFDGRSGSRQTVGDPIHLVTSRASAPQIRVFRRRGMAAVYTGEVVFRSPGHGLELTARYTIRTANNLLRHSLLHS